MIMGAFQHEGGPRMLAICRDFGSKLAINGPF